MINKELKFMGNITTVLQYISPKYVYTTSRFNEKSIWNIRHALWNVLGYNQAKRSR